MRYPYNEEWDGDYRSYMEMLQGDVTEEKAAFLEQEREYFASLDSSQSQSGTNNNTSVEYGTSANDIILKILKTKKVAFDEVTHEYEHVLAMREKGIDAKLLDRHIYSGFIYNFTREWRNMLILFILLVIIMPSVFSLDYKHSMVTILRPNRNGKGCLCADKFLLLSLSTIICWAAVFIPYTYRFIKTYGTEYLSVPISSMIDFAPSGNISILTAYIMSSVLYLLTALLITMLTAAVSVAVKDGMLSVIVSAVLVLIPTAIIGAFDNICFGTIFTAAPMKITAASVIIALVGITAAIIYTSIRFANLHIGRCNK